MHANYGGRWTALFCIGDQRRIPPLLASEGLYRFRNSAGYDGQYYHLIAHDPRPSGPLAAWIDAPRLRYARILVPGLAWLLAAGRDAWIDAAFFFVIASFTAVGVWWCSQYARAHGLPPSMGVLFVAVPAVLVSIDRMAVDVALAALMAGIAVRYSRRQRGWLLWGMLAAAALARETGLLLIAAAVICESARKRWRDAAVLATAAVPALLWFASVARRTPPFEVIRGWHISILGIVQRYWMLEAYEPGMPYAPVVRVLDHVALTGFIAAIAIAAVLVLRRRPPELMPVVAALFAALAAALPPNESWGHPYHYGRSFTPLLLALALEGMRTRGFWLTAPMLAVVPRVLAQFGFQVRGVLAAIAE